MVFITNGLKARKHREGWDESWNDPLGLEQAQENKRHEVSVDSASDNVIDRFLARWLNPQLLVGREVWAKKDEGDAVYSGRIMSVLASRILLIKHKAKTLPVPFEHVVSMGD